jgi:ubiquinone biosynthesis accessory factor UbiJ
MMIKALLMAGVETAINRYLSFDNNSSAYLAPLAGKVIAITVLPFNETIYLCPTADAIQCLADTGETPNTRITGTPWALGLMGMSSKPMRSVFSGQVTIEGDTQTGRKFQELFAKLDINLETVLALYTGKHIAHNLGQFLRSGQDWSKESIETFKLNLSEFLQEETRDLPAGPEIDIFYSQVDQIRLDFDRLNSRIERLIRTLSANEQT